MPREVREFWHGVGKPARADIVNRKNRVVCAACPAAVDHFLRTALHFGVAALHGIKVQTFGVGTRGHGACRAAPEADAHPGAPEHNHEGSRRERLLRCLVVTDVADTARKHNGLVVTVAHRADVRFKRTEVAEDVGAAEFVIKSRGTDRAFGHDGQGRCNTARCPVDAFRRFFPAVCVLVVFPGLRGVREMKRRDREAAEARLRARAAARCTFVADFAA